MTLRIGVLPALSRKTPTPTSILSGRGSASQSAINASSESLMTGGRSERPRAFASVVVSMGPRLAKLRVVIHSNAVTQRHRLTGQHITLRDLLVGKAVASRHLDLALRHLGAAGRANPCLARKRGRKTCRASAVEDIARSEGY